MAKPEKNLGELMGLSVQVSMADQLYQRISKLILSGELGEGYLFPNEAVLCEQLKVGRSTLREAYKALELSGYITRSKRGTTVNSHTEILNRTPLKTIFHAASTEDFLKFRLMVESESAYCAAVHAGLSDVESLELLVSNMKEARNFGKFETLMELDEQFHIKIANLSGNSLINAVITVMAEEWKAGIQRNFSAAIKKNLEIFDKMIEQHIAIVDAIRNQKSESAGALMRGHIEAMTIRE